MSTTYQCKPSDKTCLVVPAITLTKDVFDQYAGNRDAAFLSLAVDYDPNKLGAVVSIRNVDDPNKEAVLSGTIPNAVAAAVRSGGWIQPSECPGGGGGKPCPKLDAYIVTIVIFVLLAVLGWVLFLWRVFA